MSSIAAQRLQKLMDSRRVRGDRTHGFAGDLEGTVEAEKPGYMFVRVPKGSGWEVGEFPGSVSAAGIPVTLERDPFTGQQVVTTGGDGGAIAYNGGGSITVDPGQYAFSAHADRHGLTGDDQLNVSTLLLSPLTITVALPRLIVVGAGAFMISGVNYFKSASSSLDLSSCYPASGVKYVWVLLSSTGVLSYQDDPATTYSALVQPPSTQYIVAIAQLQAGSNLKITDVLDLRFKQPVLPKPTRGNLITGQDATATWKVLAKGTQYQVLTGGVDEPTWGAVNLGQATAVTGTLLVGSGGTGIATTTAFSVICAGTTATGAFQSLASLGNAGEVLTSNGAAALPTWQAAGGGVPALTATYVGFGDAGDLLTGSANLTWDSTRLMAQIADAATNTVVYPMRVSHITSDTAAVGFGTGVEFQLEAASGTAKEAGSVSFTWNDPLANKEISQMEIRGHHAPGGVEAFPLIGVIVSTKTTGDPFVDGNARGVGAIELQTHRTVVTQVASGANSTIVGGGQNTASGGVATIVGGGSNTADGSRSTIVGGTYNSISSDDATIVGGSYNAIGTTANYSVAMGFRAHVANTHTGTFVFADSTDADFSSVTVGEFAIRARGGFRHAYDDTYYWTAQVDSAGAVTFATTGTTFQFSDYVGIGLTPRYLFDVAGTGTESKISVQRSSSVAVGSAAGVRVIRSRGTIASPTAIESGDHLGYHEYAAYYDASNITVGAYLSARATENWDSTHKGTKLVWGVTVTGGVTGTEPLELDPVTGLLCLLPITSKPTGTAGIALNANAATGNFTLSLVPANLTAARTFTFPDTSGTVPVGTGAVGQLAVWNGINTVTGIATGSANTFLLGSGIIGNPPSWSDFMVSGTAGGLTTLAVTIGKTLTLTATDDFNLTIPKTGTAVTGTGTAGRVAAWVTDANTIQAAALIAPASNVLTLTATAASTLALAITSAKTLTLTATDNYNLTVPKTGTAVTGTGTATRVAAWSDANTIAAGTIVQPAANVLTITNGAASTLTLAITAGKILTLTAADNFNLTVPATLTVAGLAINNNFSVSQYIGDTSNADSTLGLTINQGAADDAALSLKSSDVAHGVTTVAETDTYGQLLKASATDGGIEFTGIRDTGAAAFVLVGIAPTPSTTKQSNSAGCIDFRAKKTSGDTVTDMDANSNLLVVRSNLTTRFILDADGDSHQDVGTAWTNFDAHDDVELLEALSVHVAREGDPVRSAFGEFLEINRGRLEALKLVTFNEDGHHFVNMSKLSMLLVGAVRQLGRRLNGVEAQLQLAGG